MRTREIGQCIQKCGQRGKQTIDFPSENDKPSRVKCTAKLQTDGIISKFAYRELDNYGNTLDYS
jgi:hypothetical protein